MAQWLLENGDRASVVSFLVIALSLIILGLAKQWWVPGWLYHQCMEDHEATLERERGLREEIDEGNKQALARLKVYEEIQRTTRPRKSSP
jgi:hypothetical protein